MSRRGRPSTGYSAFSDQFSAPPPRIQYSGRSGTTSISEDCLRAATTSRKPSSSFSASNAGKGNKLSTPQDPLSAWSPSEEALGGESMGTHSDGDGTSLKEDDILSTVGKRKRYENSDDPMKAWIPFSDVFLEELLRRDGLGERWRQAVCTSCKSVYQEHGNVRLLRCMDCSRMLECLDCVVARHVCTPFHILQEWNGFHWDKRTLRELGFVYQLEHDGEPCPGLESPREMTVIHTNGIHRVRYRYCSCRSTDAVSNVFQLLRSGWYPATMTDPSTCATFEVLELFRQLNVIASVNVETFMKTLTALTDPCAPDNVQNRNEAFARMERQYSYLIRVKRSGRQYRERYPGDLALLCMACPHVGVNLTDTWREEEPFKNMLILAMDANFRLKNRIRAKEKGHPALGGGSGYFVELEEYKDHLRNYVAEEDVSTCIAFAALLERDTKVTTGLRTSGVGAVVCARHECVRPLGLGDLQKGERYSNMDYIFLSSIRRTKLEHVTISYDISCQWKQNLKTRMVDLPAPLHLPETVTLQFGIPTWHAAVHELSCRTTNALGYQRGVGRTDGEGIERTWSILNDASWATKEMGEGARHDHLEDRIDYMNHRKNAGLGSFLARRLIVAVEERDRQKTNHQANTATLKPEVLAEWQAMLDAWRADKSKPNPLLLGGEQKNPSEAQVRADLKAEELQAHRDETEVVHPISATSFLAAGLTIEALQQKTVAAASSSELTLCRQTKVLDRRSSILTKLKKFRDHQRIFMPGAIRAIAEEEKHRNPESTPPTPELTPLWLPSAIPSADRAVGMAKGLPEAEARLREAQCTDALTVLRRHLHSKQHLIAWRDANAVGQAQATRSRTLIDAVSDKVRAAASKYRLARAALIALRGEDQVTHLPPLLESDLSADIVVEDDALAQRRLSTQSRKKKREHKSTGKIVVSWIWTSNLGPKDKHCGLDESIRVNWTKGRIRVDAWEEEVALIEEEMRRTLRFLDDKVKKWKKYAENVDVIDGLSHGRKAYAHRQAHLAQQMRDRFFLLWNSPFGKNEVLLAPLVGLRSIEV